MRLATGGLIAALACSSAAACETPQLQTLIDRAREAKLISIDPERLDSGILMIQVNPAVWFAMPEHEKVVFVHAMGCRFAKNPKNGAAVVSETNLLSILGIFKNGILHLR